jgi:RimJ/RimL family protein N-acetyltransferase
MSMSRSVRLVPIGPAIVDAADDPASLAVLCGASVDGVADVIASVIAQNETHRARTGASAEWGAFLAIDEHAGQVIGTCAYVGAPDAKGAVEIAYFTFSPYEGRGYGTAMAGALLSGAAARGVVRLVYAHTLPEENASTRILARHGFRQRGTAHDDDAGLVWRWERVL